MRIHKYLAHAGIASRRKSEELVKKGKVTINGKIAQIADQVNESTDKVEVDGKPVKISSLIYLALHKPSGYISTTTDPHGRKTVTDLIPEELKEFRLYPVGRLDFDSEGLLLLTNDGDLAQHLTHPSHEIKKSYDVLVRGNPADDSLIRLEEGVSLGDGETSPSKITRITNDNDSNNWLNITIHEGKKRQVRRMFEHIGHPVQRLIRVSIGPIDLGDLEIGKTRQLTPEEFNEINLIKEGK